MEEKRPLDLDTTDLTVDRGRRCMMINGWGAGGSTGGRYSPHHFQRWVVFICEGVMQ